MTEFFAVTAHVKRIKRAVLVGNIFGVIIVLFRETERDFCLFTDALHGGSGVLVVAVVNDRVGRHIGEFVEAVNQIVQRLEIVQVVLVNIQNDRDRRGKLQKRVHEFTGFTDKVFAFAHAPVGVD